MRNPCFGPNRLVTSLEHSCPADPVHDANCLAVSHCVHSLLNPGVGEARAKRLEGDLRGCMNYKHVHSLLAGTAAITQPSPGWHGGHGSEHLLLWPACDAGICGLWRRGIQSGPEMRFEHSKFLCSKVLSKYKRDQESFWHRHQKGTERAPPC